MENIKTMTRHELHQMAETIPVPFVVLNSTGVLFANPLFRKLTGYDASDLNWPDITHAIHPDQRNGFLTNLERILNLQPSLSDRELQILSQDGRFLWIEYQTSLVVIDETKWVLATLTDITTKKLNQQALRRLIKLRESMLEITQSIIGIVHMDHVYRLVLEKAIEAIEAAEVGSILLRQGSMMKVIAHQGFHNDSIAEFQLPVEELFLYKATHGKLNSIAKIDDISKLEDVYTIPLEGELESNESHIINSSISAPIMINGTFFGVVGVESTHLNAFTDDDVKIMQFIRDNVEIAISSYLLQEEKHILSQYDSLTGLYHRTFFEEIFEQILEKSKRYSESFQLVLFDLNDLKTVNDTLGHVAGDQIIKYFSDGLKKITRKSDVLGRYGGDEFIAVFHYAQPEELHNKLIHLLSSLEKEPVDVDGTPCTCSFSYGIATFDKDGLSLKELVKKADERMYQFKESYKANHPFFSPKP